MSERLPIDLQQTYDAIIRYCEKKGVDEFTGDGVGAPKGHLRALGNRGKIRHGTKIRGRGSGSPFTWKLIRKSNG